MINRRSKNKLHKVIRKYKKLYLVSFLVILNLVLPVILITASINSPIENTSDTAYSVRLEEGKEFVPHDFTKIKIQELKNEIIVRKEQERKRIEREDNINRAESILSRYNSPMMGLGEIIVRRAEECGGDFRVLLAIAGNESGFGRIPYKLYNPYGYLDGKQYSGWNEALEFLSCVISQRFLQPCNNDLVCIINKYGGSDTDKERWIYNIQWFINQI